MGDNLTCRKVRRNEMKDLVENLVLGGGLTGLALGRFLGGETAVLEAEKIPGGLCRSFSREGFTWDIGGHILFSRDRGLLEEMTLWLGENAARGRRDNRISYRGRFVKYPFENGVFALEPEERLEILLSYLGRAAKTEPANLEEWFRSRFGNALAEKYLLPYNAKIWKRDPGELSLLWVERVPDPPLEDIARAAVGIETEGYTHQLDFVYPRRGGIQALTDSLAESLPGLRTGCPALEVFREGKSWTVETPEGRYRSRRLFSTVPVFELFRLLKNVPAPVREALRGLSYNSLITAAIGVKGEVLPGATAVYVPDGKILPHRICLLKGFSPLNAPAGASGLLAEITVPPGDPLLREDPRALAEKVISQAGEICGFAPGDVVFSEVRTFPYAYVVYDLAYGLSRREAYDYLGSLGIRTAGRFGSFRYLNMDECIADARRAAGEVGR